MTSRGCTAKKRPRSAAGFSLIELLVVVIIVGLVAALAIPSMGVGRWDRHAYDDAGAIMQLFREARNRSIARGGAVLVTMSANGTTDRGTFGVWEAVSANVGATATRTPIASCKTPTSWANIDATKLTTTNPNVLLIDGLNLNSTIEADADIETAAYYYQDKTTTTQFTTPGYVCFTPLGRSYMTFTGPPVFDGLLPALSPLEFRVTRAGGGNVRSVLVPPNGLARVFSHI
jgi:type II secretion system protein H